MTRGWAYKHWQHCHAGRAYMDSLWLVGGPTSTDDTVMQVGPMDSLWRVGHGPTSGAQVYRRADILHSHLSQIIVGMWYSLKYRGRPITTFTQGVDVQHVNTGQPNGPVLWLASVVVCNAAAGRVGGRAADTARWTSTVTSRPIRATPCLNRFSHHCSAHAWKAFGCGFYVNVGPYLVAYLSFYICLPVWLQLCCIDSKMSKIHCICNTTLDVTPLNYTKTFDLRKLRMIGLK